MSFLADYKKLVAERAKQNVPPLPLNKEQTKALCELLASVSSPKNSSSVKLNEAEIAELVELLENRVSPGVDDGALVKCEFLDKILKDELRSEKIDKKHALAMLGTMLGGYNVKVLINALKRPDTAELAAKELENIIFIHDDFHTIAELAGSNAHAKAVLESWAKAEWFLRKPKLPEIIECVAFKVAGETNTDDLSPAADAFTRSDIPLHAQAMLKTRQAGSLEKIAQLKQSKRQVVYVGDVVGTGSSRKSAINSIQWHLGSDIKGVPNKRTGGIIIGSTIAPIFFNTAQDSGALPIICDVSSLEMGAEFEIHPYKGELTKDGKVIAEFKIAPNTLFDELRAGGRIPLIIGRGLCVKAREALKMPSEDIFIKPEQPKATSGGYTLAQKMLGRACGVDGVRAGMYIEPLTLTVGSQDTTGPMTRDEIKELASLGFNADLVMQSFCHTAAYPKISDAGLHKSLPHFMTSRGGVALKPGDGVIHSWLNRLVLPDTVGTGGDSHTRFPIGISFPAGSGLVAFAAVTGAMPLNVPESVLVRFVGELQAGVTLRDLVNAIPYYAIKDGKLTVEKKNKKNIFAGKILEIEGLPNLKVEQAFELSDASAERSAAACSVDLSIESVSEYVRSNVALIEAMMKSGYENKATLQRRADKMRAWLEKPTLLRADKNANYAYTLEIDLNQIKEPILACPNDPDDVATLGEILADKARPHEINEVFVGSCMTNIGHYRALGEILRGRGALKTRLWVVPPTKMDKAQLTAEGYYSIFGAAGARIEVPGCSLCMGNQARVADNAVVFSTSTRNFDNRMGMGAKVYLGSAELAAVCAILGRLPSVAEYLEIVNKRLDDTSKASIYRYLNFDEIENFELEA